MNENEHLARIIYQELNAGSPLVLISIISMEGSTPRHDGTKMVVDADGKTYGTIGGSLMEASAISEAKQIISTGKSRILSFDLTGKDAAAPDMICGGKAEILLDCLSPSAENLKFARDLNEAISQGKDVFILTKYRQKENGIKVLGHAIMGNDYALMPGTSLTAEDASNLKPELHNVSTISVLPSNESLIIVDRIRRIKTVYCFGGGHVAVPTAHLAALVGFRVVVLDDRQEYANQERFPEAALTIVVNDFDKALQGLAIDKDSFIIILTRGHQYDLTVLEQALNTSAGYIGMISSRRKRQSTFDALMEKGVAKERLDWVHSPIGLDIGGETPEEIAVSIIAELVQVRSHQSA